MDIVLKFGLMKRDILFIISKYKTWLYIVGLKTTICSGKRIVVYELILNVLDEIWKLGSAKLNILGSKGWVEVRVRSRQIIEFLYFS